MIMSTVRMIFTPNKATQAVEWARKLMAYSKKAGISGDVSLIRPSTGETNSLIWLSRHASMEEREQIHKKRRADSGWVAIVNEGIESDWFIGERRNIYEVLESAG